MPQVNERKNGSDRRGHLVLSRRRGERILVDGCASIEVCRLSKRRVVLVFHADRSTSIVREELLTATD